MEYNAYKISYRIQIGWLLPLLQISLRVLSITPLGNCVLCAAIAAILLVPRHPPSAPLPLLLVLDVVDQPDGKDVTSSDQKKSEKVTRVSVNMSTHPAVVKQNPVTNPTM